MKKIEDLKIWPDDYLNQVINGDCLEIMKLMPDKCVDLVLTDPPYPDYYADEYKYKDGIIDFLKDLPCRQFLFWTAKIDFPLDYTAIHIWDKKIGAGSQYERIFERNGGKEYKVFSYYTNNSTVAAQMTNDIKFDHPSQKPINLLKRLIQDYSEDKQTILDPFLGSGTTAVAAKQLNRNFIGIEISEKYCEIAEARLRQDTLF